MKLFPVEDIAPLPWCYIPSCAKFCILLFLVTAVLIQTIYLYISGQKFEDQGNKSKEVSLMQAEQWEPCQTWFALPTSWVYICLVPSGQISWLRQSANQYSWSIHSWKFFKCWSSRWYLEHNRASPHCLWLQVHSWSTSLDICSGTTLFCAILLIRFFSDKIWDLLVLETKWFAAQSVISLTYPWHDVTILEMKAFISVLITMGVLKHTRLVSYWTTNPPHPGHQAFPKFCQRPCWRSSSGFYTPMTVLCKSLLDILSIAAFSRWENFKI